MNRKGRTRDTWDRNPPTSYREQIYLEQHAKFTHNRQTKGTEETLAKNNR